MATRQHKTCDTWLGMRAAVTKAFKNKTLLVIKGRKIYVSDI